jgi:ketosteroid isomerase-like protein
MVLTYCKVSRQGTHTGQKAAHHIYQQWHDYARGNPVDALLNLYAEDAVLETPLVPAILDRLSGVLTGNQEIGEFLGGRYEAAAEPACTLG